MPDAKITELPPGTVMGDCLLPLVCDPVGAPVTAKATVDDLLNFAFDAFFPVGSVVIRETAPSRGTWEAFGAGRALVGLNAADADFDLVGKTGGAKTVTPTGTNSAPTFTGTQASLTHSGAAVADHASHTHSVTSNVAVADHASHTHTFTQSSNAATPDLVTANTASQGVAASGTTGGPNAALTHSVTNNAVTSGAPSATLTHAVTQPTAHTYTPQGTVAAPTFTGTVQSNLQPYIVVPCWIRTA